MSCTCDVRRDVDFDLLLSSRTCTLVVSPIVTVFRRFFLSSFSAKISSTDFVVNFPSLLRLVLFIAKTCALLLNQSALGVADRRAVFAGV